MTSPWLAEHQLRAWSVRCRCAGSLGCLHGVGTAPGRLSPSRQDFDLRVLEIGGLDLETVRLRADAPMPVPRVIPVVDGGRASWGVSRPAVAVMLDAARPVRTRRKESLRETLGVGPEVSIVLTLFASDGDLERLWHERLAFVERLRLLRPSAVISPSFSVWHGDDWVEQRYAMKRSLEFARIVQEVGLRAIPHVSWGRETDALDLARWINSNRPGMIAIDTQCLAGLFDDWLRQLDFIRERIAVPPRLLIGGTRPGQRLQRIATTWPECSFLYNGLQPAASGHVMNIGPDGRTRYRRVHLADDRRHLSIWADWGR